VVGAVEVDVEDGLPVFGFHFEEALVAEDAGVVDEDIEASEGGEGGFDDAFASLGGGDVVVVGDGLAAAGLDFRDDLVGGGTGAVPGTVTGAAEVVDHDPGSPFGELQGVHPSQAAPRPRDHRHAAVKTDLVRGDGAVFEDAVVDDDVAGFGVQGPPDGPALAGLPDEGLDGLAGIKGLREAAGQAPDQFGLPRGEFFHEGAAGEAVGAQAVHDGLFEAHLSGEAGINVELEEIAGEAVEEGLIGGWLGCNDEIGIARRENERLGFPLLAAEVAVQAAEDGDDILEELVAVGVDGIPRGDDDGALVLLVVVVGEGPLGCQGPRGGDGAVKDDVLLTVEDARQIHIGGAGHVPEEVEDAGHGKAGDDLEIFFVNVIQFVEARADSQGVQGDVLPGIGLGDRTDFLAECL